MQVQLAGAVLSPRAPSGAQAVRIVLGTVSPGCTPDAAELTGLWAKSASAIKYRLSCCVTGCSQAELSRVGPCGTYTD